MCKRIRQTYNTYSNKACRKQSKSYLHNFLNKTNGQSCEKSQLRQIFQYRGSTKGPLVLGVVATWYSPTPSVICSFFFSFIFSSHLISSHLIYIHNLAIIQIIPSTILQSYRYTQDSHRTTFTRYNRLLVFLNIATSCTPSVGIRSTWVYRWVWMNPQAHKYIIVALYLRSIPKGI
jgi:hypothetical protein